MKATFKEDLVKKESIYDKLLSKMCIIYSTMQ